MSISDFGHMIDTSPQELFYHMTGRWSYHPKKKSICLFYINNSYRAEGYVRTISSLERELKDLRSEYITTKSLLMFQSKQTEVQSLVASQGLQQSNSQPFIIRAN